MRQAGQATPRYMNQNANAQRSDDTVVSYYDSGARSEEENTKGVRRPGYCDARLRGLTDSWVVFKRSPVKVPEEVERVSQGYPLLLGFLYVDRRNGFRLRVQQELTRATPQTSRVYWAGRLDQYKWDLPYDQIKNLPLRECERWEAHALGLPPFPVRIVMAGHVNSALSRCRRIQALDIFRTPGHPDIVKVWNKVGDNPRGEQILVLLENEKSESLFSGTLVFRAGSVANKAGTRIDCALFELDGEVGLFRLDSSTGDATKSS